jgi:pectate lyase
MKGVANWIMVIGGVIMGIIIFTISISLLINHIKTMKRQTVLGELQDLHDQLTTVCKMGLGHKKTFYLVLPDTVRAVYVANRSYEPPPDRVSVYISDKVSAVGNHTCIQFFDDNIPICQYIGCDTQLTYMGSPSLKSSLQVLLAQLKGEYPVYEYTVEIEKADEYFLNVKGDMGIKEGKSTTTTTSGTTPTTTTAESGYLDLLNEVVGFGERTTGGEMGDIYYVINTNDDGPGSLRYGSEMDGPLWIVFNLPGGEGIIETDDRIDIKSDKTIDGRGQRVVIRGRGFEIGESDEHISNVIIENIIFENGLPNGKDAITIRMGAENIWIDHCSFSNFDDGLIDVIQESTDITISWSKFSNHDKVIILGRHEEPDNQNVKVTLHHNYFTNTRQRNPKVSWGKVHAYNNYIERWEVYGMGSSSYGQLYSQANIFEAGSDKDAFRFDFHAFDDQEAGYIKSVDDLFQNGAELKENVPENVFNPNDYYSFRVEPADQALKDKIVSGAGWRNVDYPNLP